MQLALKYSPITADAGREETKRKKKVKWEKMEERKGAKYIMGITRTVVL